MKNIRNIVLALAVLTLSAQAATPIKDLVLQSNADAGGNQITNLAAPTNSGDAATFGWASSTFLTGLSGHNVSELTNDAGFIMQGSWDSMGGTQSNVSLSGFTNDAGFVTQGSWDSMGGTQSNVYLSGFTNDLSLSGMDGSGLTGVQLPLTAGTDYLAPTGEASGLTVGGATVFGNGTGYYFDSSGNANFANYAASAGSSGTAGSGWPTALSGFTNDLSLTGMDGSGLTFPASVYFPNLTVGDSDTAGYATTAGSASSASNATNLVDAGGKFIYGDGAGNFVVGDGSSPSGNFSAGFFYGDASNLTSIPNPFDQSLNAYDNATFNSVSTGNISAAPGGGEIWLSNNGGATKIDGTGNIRAPKFYGDGTPLTFAATPGAATATGTAGQIAQDGVYLYLCTATDTWVRAPISTLFSTW